MAENYSDKSKSELVSKIQSMKDRMAKVRETASEAISTVTTTAVAGGTAFGLEYMRARYGKLDQETDQIVYGFAGLPASLLVGVAGHVGGFLGLGGKTSAKLLHDLGHGGVAAYGSSMGYQMGLKAFNDAGEPRATVEGYMIPPKRQQRRQQYLGPSTPLSGAPYQAAGMRSPMYAR